MQVRLEDSQFMDVAFMAKSANKAALRPLVDRMDQINEAALGDHTFESTLKGDLSLDSFSFEGWRRYFQGNLKSGGRLDHPYMRAKRTVRSSWLIGDEPLTQIDVHACGLTILSSLRGYPVNPEQEGELYQKLQMESPRGHHMPDRSVIKKTVQSVISNDYLPEGLYPSGVTDDAKLDALSKELPWVLVRSAIEQHYPWITSGQKRGRKKSKQSGEVHYAESNWMLDVMERLLEERIGVLSLHDAVLVPVSRADRAERIVRQTFEAHFGIRPKLSVEKL